MAQQSDRYHNGTGRGSATDDIEIRMKQSPNGVPWHDERKEKKAKPERDVWNSPAEFVLSCLGYAVGLGNIWRFPWLCYQNGGGAFLIPYVLCLLFIGLPVFFLELIMGQYSGQGPLTVWSCVPLLKGIGAGMVLITSLFCVFYTMILAYSFYYLFGSFVGQLPWDTCKAWYNSDFCFNLKESQECMESNLTFFNKTCFSADDLDADPQLANNVALFYYNKSVSSAEEYLNNGVLEMTETIEDFGGIKWQLVLCLLLAWLICFLCLLKGIKSAGKVVYFTAIFPYIVITILLIWAARLPGARDGIDFYIKPDWSKLASAQVWGDAAGQIFFSLSVGSGGLMTFSSYNKFNNNIYRDALIVAFGNCLTSFYAGFAIFSILGNMAYVLDKSVADVAAEGSTLAFVAYPQVVATMPVPQLWAVLFFLMLITLGLDSLFAGMETVVTATVDTFPSLWKRKTLVTGVLCLMFFLIGLPMTTRAGIYWLNLIAYYCSGWSLIIIGLAELIGFAWIYGARKIRDHVQEMVAIKLWPHWLGLWIVLSPLLLLAILIVNWIQFRPLSFGPYVLPMWAQVIGWLIALSPVVLIVIFALGVLISSYCNDAYVDMGICQRLVYFLKPSPEWGPSESDCDEIRLKSTNSYNISSSAHDNPAFVNNYR